MRVSGYAKRLRRGSATGRGVVGKAISGSKLTRQRTSRQTKGNGGRREKKDDDERFQRYGRLQAGGQKYGLVIRQLLGLSLWTDGAFIAFDGDAPRRYPLFLRDLKHDTVWLCTGWRPFSTDDIHCETVVFCLLGRACSGAPAGFAMLARNSWLARGGDAMARS